MALSIGERGRNERDTFHKQAHLFIQHTYVQPRQSCNIQARKSKSHTTEYDYYVQLLNRFYLADGTTTFIQKPKRKGHPQRRGWQTGSVDLYVRGAWLTEWAPRDRRWLPAPSRCLGGRRALSGTPLPTARQSWSSAHNPRDFSPRGKGSTSTTSTPRRRNHQKTRA